jgi:hypothetical protein
MTSTKTKPITAKRAAEIARTYLKDLKNPKNILLEEVDQSDNDNFWLITLSHDTAFSENVIGFLKGRSYKIFKIDKYSGKVISMKLRRA